MSHLPISLLTLLSVVACAPVASNEPPPGGEDGGESAVGGKPRMTGGALPPEEQIRVGPGILDANCRAEAAQRFVGQNADEDTVRAAVAASGATLARVMRPGMMVTMEFRGDRLNLRVDDGGRIVEITCG